MTVDEIELWWHLTQRQKRACISSNRFFPKGYFFLLNNSNLPYRLSAKRIVNLIVIIESCQKGYVCLSDVLSADIKNNTQLYVFHNLDIFQSSTERILSVRIFLDSLDTFFSIASSMSVE